MLLIYGIKVYDFLWTQVGNISWKILLLFFLILFVVWSLKYCRYIHSLLANQTIQYRRLSLHFTHKPISYTISHKYIFDTYPDYYFLKFVIRLLGDTKYFVLMIFNLIWIFVYCINDLTKKKIWLFNFLSKTFFLNYNLSFLSLNLDYIFFF